jgi:HAMP domain-containing protein
MDTPDINALALLAVAVLNALSVALSLVNNRNIRKIEIATNSMKDALVASTAKASDAIGEARGLAKGRSEERPPLEKPGDT